MTHQIRRGHAGTCPPPFFPSHSACPAKKIFHRRHLTHHLLGTIVAHPNSPFSAISIPTDLTHQAPISGDRMTLPQLQSESGCYKKIQPPLLFAPTRFLTHQSFPTGQNRGTLRPGKTRAQSLPCFFITFKKEAV